MRKKREVLQEYTRLINYAADNHMIETSCHVQSGVYITLKWILGDMDSPIDKISAIDKNVIAARELMEKNKGIADAAKESIKKISEGKCTTTK